MDDGVKENDERYDGDGTDEGKRVLSIAELLGLSPYSGAPGSSREDAGGVDSQVPDAGVA